MATQTAVPNPTHLVLRAFNGPGDQTFERGARIAATGFRTLRLLEEQRYLRPLLPVDFEQPAGEQKTAKPVDTKREKS